MGSFNSKARAIRNGGRKYGDHPKGEISGGVEDEILSITDDSEIIKDSKIQGQAEGANGGVSSSADTRHQQHTAPRMHHSFSGLASNSVVFNAIANVQEGKGKPFIEGGSKSSNVMVYSNGKYLKSCSTPPSSLPRKRPKESHSTMLVRPQLRRRTTTVNSLLMKNVTKKATMNRTQTSFVRDKKMSVICYYQEQALDFSHSSFHNVSQCTTNTKYLVTVQALS